MGSNGRCGLCTEPMGLTDQAPEFVSITRAARCGDACRKITNGFGEWGLIRCHGQAGVWFRSIVAQNKPATMRPAARGSDAVQVAPISRMADSVRVMILRKVS